MKYPECGGCKESGQLCCVEWDAYRFQPYNDEQQVCCVLDSSVIELVPYEPRCNWYAQYFCCEMVMNKIPPLSGDLHRKVKSHVSNNDTRVYR